MRLVGETDFGGGCDEGCSSSQQRLCAAGALEAYEVAGAPRGQPEPERVASPIATRRDPPRGGTGHRDATVTQDQVHAAVCRDGTPTRAATGAPQR